MQTPQVLIGDQVKQQQKSDLSWTQSYTFEVRIMKGLKVFSDLIQYFSGGISRIFGLSDDQYPNIGVQPFEGEPNENPHYS